MQVLVMEMEADRCARPEAQPQRVAEARLSVMLLELSGVRTQSARLQEKLRWRGCAKPFSERPGLLVRHRVRATTECESHSLHYRLRITTGRRIASQIAMRSATW